MSESVETIALVGAGGLGVSALWGLIPALKGKPCRIDVFDPEKIELSNLNRQLFFRTDEVSRSDPTDQFKAEVLCRRAGEILGPLPGITLKPRIEHIDENTVAGALSGARLVIDACDCAQTKFMLNDYCVLNRVPLCYGGVLGDAGMAMLIPASPGGACLRCLFGELSADELADQGNSCRAGGILGTVAGLIGFMQAELAAGALSGDDLSSRLLRLDSSLDLRSQTIAPAKDRPLGCGVRVSQSIDLRDKVCPETFLYTKLALEQMSSGEVLEVRVSSSEFAQSVAATAGEEGNSVVSSPRKAGPSSWRLLLRAERREA